MSSKIKYATLITFSILFVLAVIAAIFWDITSEEKGQQITVKVHQKETAVQELHPWLSEIRNFYGAQAVHRNNVLKKMTNDSDFGHFLNTLVPEVYCLKKVRIGFTWESNEKWMCNPWKVPADCLIVSADLSDAKFELHLQQVTHSRCRLLGISKMQPHEWYVSQYKELNGTIKIAEISQKTEKEKGKFTLADLVGETKMNEVEVLKMELDGAEHSVLEPFFEKNTLFVR
ncbi:unnamed protein product [Caenorhabditis auriculariae]|uniref:Methyltransferase domain-containing protein n=1 Tax=Caenorhabditis auriculariae TaxID=2777116 RepID=A0A8S1HJX6_9PELO|nr:unnamed protein product [Caenorhabditis auriculariae]